MQVVSQEIGASVATMSIEDSEKAALWPVLDILLGLWLHDVEHDADPVFVVVPDDALVRVGCIADDVAGLSDAALGGLPERQVDRGRLRWRAIAEQQGFDVKFLLLLSHFALLVAI